MRRRKKGAHLDGSITVEASILVPIVLLVVAAMIFFCFYLHDSVRLNLTLHNLTEEAVNYIAYEVNPENGEINYNNAVNQSILYFAGIQKGTKKSILTNYCKKKLEDGFFITSVTSTKVEIGISNVEITVTAHFDIPIPWIASLFGWREVNRTISMKKSYFKREEIARVLTVVSETGEQIKGVSEAIEKVKDIVNKIR